MDYRPTAVPNDCPPSLKAWLARELVRIAEDKLSHTPAGIQLQVLGAEPNRVTEGLVVFADGTLWNPGSGRGFYGYRSGAWRKLD